MDLLKVKKSLLLTAHGKAVVRKYNKMALVLTEYEILHYQSWVKIVNVCHRNVQVADTRTLASIIDVKNYFTFQ